MEQELLCIHATADAGSFRQPVFCLQNKCTNLARVQFGARGEPS
jgi:hypothetical protein